MIAGDTCAAERYPGSIRPSQRSGRRLAHARISVADNLETEWLGPAVNSDPRMHGEMLSSPVSIPGVSDGGAYIKFLTLGVYPTDMLSWLVRDTGTLTLG